MSVFIGIPSGRGSLSVETATTAMNLGLIFQKRDIQYRFASVSHAEVSTARNLLAALFLESKLDTFIGIDDDIGVDINVLEQLLDFDAKFLAVYQPQRVISLDSFEAAVLAGKRGIAAQFAAAPYVGVDSNSRNPEYGKIEKVKFIGTGFFILKRAVLKGIIDQKLALSMHTKMPNLSQKTYGFFNNITDDELGHLSEDYSFCTRVSRAGFDIHAYLGPGISHTGPMKFVS
jgi:hypothetical protein